jgi:putative endonuclease
MWFVYILRCADGSLYTGCTSGVDERLIRHNSGQVPATKFRLPVTLITYVAFTDKYRAFEFENISRAAQEGLF